MRSKGKTILGIVLIVASLFAVTTKTAGAFPVGDANSDYRVDGVDYLVWLSNYGLTVSGVDKGNFNGDPKVDGLDYLIWLANYGTIQTPPPVNPPPAPVPPTTSSSEWSQFAGNAQRTSYNPNGVTTPWKYLWQWNGAGADGKKQAGHLSVPDLVQPITGGGMIYMVAADTVYAFNQTGSVVWTRGGMGTLSATPAYANGYIYVGSGNGTIYQLRSDNGQIVTNAVLGGQLNNAPLITSTALVIGSSSGIVYSLDPTNLTKKWQYTANSPIVSPATYSLNKNMVFVNAQDLNVHAINAQTGALVWKTKPVTDRVYMSGNPTSAGAQFEEGWPVVAEQHGIVFVRYRLDWDTLWGGNPFPTTNAAIRTLLTDKTKPSQQALYALDMATGNIAFVPAVGNGGQGDGGFLPMGPQPIVSNIEGKEVVYIIWRNGLTCAGGWCDGREDATMGEMVLDSTTVPGYNAGDVRFVKFIDIQTDEMVNITMGGNVIFHSHWLSSEAAQITDRSNALGATFANPIKTVDAPFVIWRQVYCAPGNSSCNPQLFPGGTGTSYGPSDCIFNALTRYCTKLYSYGDQRAFPAGFYEYYNDNNSGSSPYTVVSNGLVLVKTNDGALIVLGSGNPTADAGGNKTIAYKASDKILGASTEIKNISTTEGLTSVGQNVKVTGTLNLMEDHLPKAMYFNFSTQSIHDPKSILIRIFNKDVNKFTYKLSTLKGKNVTVTGMVSLYWPELTSPEIIVTEPSQIQINN